MPVLMDLKRVRAFLAVADALSVTKAAQQLHISQPPLSRAIHQLEEELGVTLFVRHAHGVTLTEAGRQLLEKARALDDAASEFTVTAKQMSYSGQPQIRVGIGWGLWDLVNRVRVEFSRTCPEVGITATDAFCWYDSDEQLRSRSVDVAFARPPFDSSLRVSEPIDHEPIQAIVPDSSPLVTQASLSVRDLASHPLLLWERRNAPVLYDQIHALYRRAGLVPETIPTPGAGPFNHAGKMLVASGKGVYLGHGVPLTAPCSPSGVAVRPLNDPGATTEIRIVSRKGDASPVVGRFLECVSRVFSEPSAVGARRWAAGGR
jgi:DNA-binding transcriptional LysR family regulator